MSRKRVALSVLTPRPRRQQQQQQQQQQKQRRRHNDDIHDEDVENQEPSPQPMPPIILPQAFLHAPNTFKTSKSHLCYEQYELYSIEFQNVVYSMRSCPNTQALSLKVFYHYISVHRPKTQRGRGSSVGRARDSGWVSVSIM